MNVSGVGATPAPPPLPAISPVTSASLPEAHGDTGSAGTGSAPAPRARPERRADPVDRPAPRVDVPPLKVLTVTEMRVMLGQLPARPDIEDTHADAARADLYL